MTGHALATAAADLVGVRFRLHGRDPRHGLDCIGLLGAALARIGRPIALPDDYPLRLARPDDWLPDCAACGFALAELPCAPGDVVLLRPAVAQAHLAIAGHDGTWVHAHAGLRRVVIAPVRPVGQILHHWRLRAPN